MITQKNKYYIVYEGDKLIMDLGLIERATELKTKKSVFITNNEKDYLNKLNTLQDEQKIDYR